MKDQERVPIHIVRWDRDIGDQKGEAFGLGRVRFQLRQMFRLYLLLSGGLMLAMSGTPQARNVEGRSLSQVLHPEVVEVPDFWTPQPKPPLLIPRPQKVEWGAGVFRLNPQTVLRIESERYRPAARVFQEEIETRYGWHLPIQSLSSGESYRDSEILFGGSRERRRRLSVPDLPEAYGLLVTPKKVEVIGAQPRGTFYGAQTLLQLVQVIPGGLQIPAVTIRDYPNLAFRGVHLLGGTDPTFHERLIRNVLAHFKLNHLVLQCEYSQWQTNPALWTDFSMPKEALKKIVKVARANFLEPIPLIPSLGHCEWMFRNRQNLHLAEDPETPYAYCPRREATYKFLFGVLDEVLAVFKPRYFHIGHDEVTMRGRFPYSPECEGATVAQLFVEDTRRLVEYLQGKRVERVFLWADMLLGRTETHDGSAFAASEQEAQQTRQQLPKNLVLCDWHYVPAEPDQYKSLEVLQEARFDRLIATTWFDPRNIFTFAQAASKRGLWGLLQSTWAGFNLQEVTLRDALPQFAAYVLAAEYAWNPDSPPPDRLPYHPETVFLERYYREPMPLTPQPGFLVDLRSGYNFLFSEAPATLQGWQAMPTGTVRLNGWLFRLVDSLNQPAALMLASPGGPDPSNRYPASVLIEIRRKVQELHFLHCAGAPAAAKEEMGRYLIRYEDGNEETVPLLYGLHIRAWNDPGMAAQARIVWEGKTAQGTPVLLRSLRWHNPHPGKMIQQIELRATSRTAALCLIGLSGR